MGNNYENSCDNQELSFLCTQQYIPAITQKRRLNVEITCTFRVFINYVHWVFSLLVLSYCDLTFSFEKLNHDSRRKTRCEQDQTVQCCVRLFPCINNIFWSILGLRSTLVIKKYSRIISSHLQILHFPDTFALSRSGWASSLFRSGIDVNEK